MSVDVVVVGGGPAGCIAARRLAAQGARVVLYAGATAPGREGVSRRAQALLEDEDPDTARHALRGPVARGGEWGNARAIVGSEWLVDRTVLAMGLRQAALAAGVELRSGIVNRIEQRALGVGVESLAAGPCQARLLIDARGRRGPARRGPVLAATGQAFVTDAPMHPGTAIYPFAQGWCWLVTEPGAVWVQLAGTVRAIRSDTLLSAARAQIAPLAAALQGARPAGPATIRPAHASLGRRSADLARWRVGDAAFAPDPLSGQGIYEAVRSARLIATAIDSVLRGGDAALAQRFAAERQHAAWRRHLAIAADLYGENAARGRFWSATAAAYRALLVVPKLQRPALERPSLSSGG